MSHFPPPPKAVKRKRRPVAEVPTPTKRKRVDSPVVKSDNNNNPADSGLPKAVLNKITYGTTRKQRHWVLQQMVKAVHGDDDKDLEYFRRVEHRLYNAIFGKTMNASYNLYRGELYRKFAFEIIYALRALDGRHGRHLMQKYSPELLAALPAPFLAEGTPAGEVYAQWKKKQTDRLMVEEEMRRAKHDTKGEGWLRCHKCGGRFEVRELQMRGGDEPATIFRTCQNCGFTKRNG